MKRAEKICRDYNLAKGEVVIIHWDGKLLSTLAGKTLVDGLPIIASVNGREQLLGYYIIHIYIYINIIHIFLMILLIALIIYTQPLHLQINKK